VDRRSLSVRASKVPRVTDWIAWHGAYEDESSSLARRLVVVKRFIAAALDAAAPGPIRVVHLCAGDARDLIGVASDHPRSRDVVGRIVEFDPDLAAIARRSAQDAGLTGLEVMTGDAGDPCAYEGATPADLVLACGVFGNIVDEDIARTIAFFATMCSPDARVIWTRGRLPSNDFTPTIRAWFGNHDFNELAFVAPDDAMFSVGVHLFVGPRRETTPDRRLFSFVG
jgi:hypothetical protein